VPPSPFGAQERLTDRDRTKPLATQTRNPLLALLGFIGLPLGLFHVDLAYDVAESLGVVPHVLPPVQCAQLIHTSVLSAGVWSPTYGLLGWVIDRLSARSSARGIDSRAA
jgi:hypothetical protein